jgi:hypothetical protein
VQLGLPHIIQLKNAEIVYFDEWKDYLGSTLCYCTLEVMINYFISLLMCPYGFQ